MSPEAAPVISGRVDDQIISEIFRGWQNSRELQVKFNPWVEMTKAREARDRTIQQFDVKPYELAGFSNSMEALTAQAHLIGALKYRQWSPDMINRYLGIK